jgi:prepilin-type N-terminal cleavage/methylation domain-containing protein
MEGYSMKQLFRRISKRSRWGFTLIELVAVMAILAVLVAIVAPAGINSERASIQSQAQADSQQVRNAAVQFFTDSKESEVIFPHSVTLTTSINSLAVSSTTQKVSSRWPEIYVTQGSGVPTLTGKSANSKYSAIFETVTGPKVVNVTLKDEKGVVITGSTFLTKFTAIDLTTLVSNGVLQKLPDGVDRTSNTGVGTLKAPNFLWLLQKQSSSFRVDSAGIDDDRGVTVFILVKVEQIEPPAATTTGATTVNLTYEQILGP